jgi:transcription termination factor Rho
MELVLNRRLAEKRIYPAVSVSKSGTRKEEKLFNDNEYQVVTRLRRHLGSLDDERAIKFLLEQLEKYETNADFLGAIATGDLELELQNTR